MCAKKVRKHLASHETPIGTSSRRRPEVVQWGAQETGRRAEMLSSLTHEMDEDTALKVLRKNMTWRDWFIYDFLRYWYAMGVLAITAFSVTHIAWRYHVRDAFGLSALALGGFALIVLGFALYKTIWPKGAFTEGWPVGKRLRKAIRVLRWRL